jgi:hypothetical protein
MCDMRAHNDGAGVGEDEYVCLLYINCSATRLFVGNSAAKKVILIVFYILLVQYLFPCAH